MLLETIKTFVNINKLPFFSGIIIKKEGDLHYIGGNEVLPPPLSAKEEYQLSLIHI